MRRPGWLQVLGAALVLLGVLGFLTVADDLRHGGEIVGVGSVLLTGILLLFVAFRRRRKQS